MSREEILAVIERTANKTEASRARKKSKGNATAWYTVWQDAMADAGYDKVSVAPTQKILGMLGRAMARIDGDVEYKRRFIDSTVANWPFIVPYISKTLRHTEVPDLGMFVALIDRFYASYCRRRVEGLPSVRTPDDRIAELEAKVAKLQSLNDKLTKDNERLRADIKRAVPPASGGRKLAKWR